MWSWSIGPIHQCLYQGSAHSRVLCWHFMPCIACGSRLCLIRHKIFKKSLPFHNILVHLNVADRIGTLVLHCAAGVFSDIMENALKLALLPHRTVALWVCWHHPLQSPTTLYPLDYTLPSHLCEFIVILINQVIPLTHSIPIIYPYWVVQPVRDPSWCYWQTRLVQGGLKNHSLLFLWCCRWAVGSVELINEYFDRGIQGKPLEVCGFCWTKVKGTLI